jgi:3-keto-disaccharide hydrolase
MQKTAHRKTAFTISFLLLAVLSAFKTTHLQEDNVLTEKEKKEGWKLLFDGKTTQGWRSYKNKDVDSWKVANGELYCIKEAKNHADLITLDKYKNFDLTFDWKVDKGSNSGLIYRANEDHDASYKSGPEYQLMDDNGFAGKLKESQRSGADYDMHAPLKFLSKPAGEFNSSRIFVKDAHVEHWLNGEKVVDFELWTPEWSGLKEKSKWKDEKEYGMVKEGYIVLQDHGGGISFKNVKIRKLD